MKKYKLALLSVVVIFASCKKENKEPEPQVNSNQTTYTKQYLVKSGQGAASNGIYWVIAGDTMNLGQCTGTYSANDYVKTFSFEVDKDYQFKILRRLPASTIFEVKNEGIIKFIDAKSSTDLYGGVSSLVITPGPTWTYSIMYGQCGSIINQLGVMVP